MQEERGLVDEPVGRRRVGHHQARGGRLQRDALLGRRARRGRAGRSAARAGRPRPRAPAGGPAATWRPGGRPATAQSIPSVCRCSTAPVGSEDHHIDVVAGAEQLQRVDVEAVALLDDRQPLDAARAEALERVERRQRRRAASRAPCLGLVDVGGRAGAQRGQAPAGRAGHDRPGGGASRDGT